MIRSDEPGRDVVEEGRWQDRRCSKTDKTDIVACMVHYGLMIVMGLLLIACGVVYVYSDAKMTVRDLEASYGSTDSILDWEDGGVSNGNNNNNHDGGKEDVVKRVENATTIMCCLSDDSWGASFTINFMLEIMIREYAGDYRLSPRMCKILRYHMRGMLRGAKDKNPDQFLEALKRLGEAGVRYKDEFFHVAGEEGKKEREEEDLGVEYEENEEEKKQGAGGGEEEEYDGGGENQSHPTTERVG